jgi:signal transduction histidine kinase
MTQRAANNMNKKLKTVQKTFIISIVSLTFVSVVSLGAVLFTTNAIALRHTVSSSELHSLTKSYPEVEAYLQTQKKAEPHFIRIANLVKSDQQRLLGRALFYTGVPILMLSVLLAYILAKRLVEPVEESFNAQERFLQDASHEMRNPLAALYAIVQDAQNIEATADSRASTKKTLKTIELQTEQLVKLNEDLLMLERSKTSRDRATSIDLSELLLDVIDSKYAQAKLRKIRFKQTITPKIRFVITDSDWVCIAQNLIDNAIKYSKDASIITIKLTHTKQTVTLSVQDKGIGIPADQIAHIGERFFRSTNVGRTPGTGLGMAIVSQIVESYHGALTIKSTPGKGSTFAVSLPVKKIS